VQVSDIKFVSDMGFVQIWEYIVQPFVCAFQLVLGGRDHYLVVDFCLLDVNAPRLFLNDLLERSLIDICIGIEQKGDIKGFVLEITQRYGRHSVNEGVVFFQEVDVFIAPQDMNRTCWDKHSNLFLVSNRRGELGKEFFE